MRQPVPGLLVRLLAVVGGAFVLLVLGAAAAGAATSRPADARPHDPSSVTVPTPSAATPLVPPHGGSSLDQPGVSADVGPTGVAVDADPVAVVPSSPQLPLPLLPPTIPLVPRSVDLATSGRAIEGHTLVAADTGRDAASTRDTPPPTPVRPGPARPMVPSPVAPLPIALAGLALGVQRTTRHGGLDDHAVTSARVRVIRRPVRQGRHALPRGLAPRPGFSLLPARPG